MHSGTDLEMRDGMRSEEQEELEIASVGHSLPKWTYAIQYQERKVGSFPLHPSSLTY